MKPISPRDQRRRGHRADFYARLVEFANKNNLTLFDALRRVTNNRHPSA
jgi:hypothetical protein